MPFTPAHIGFMLPLHHRWNQLSLPALIIGSIVPDVDFLFRFTHLRFHAFSISLTTILLMMLPLCWVFYCYYSWVIKDCLKHINIFHSLPSSAIFSPSSNSILVKGIRLSGTFLLAIFVHLWLDIIGHSLDAHACFLFIRTFSSDVLLGKLFYYAGMYGLPVVLSIIGFLLINKYKAYCVGSIRSISAPSSKQLLFYIIWLLMFLIVVYYKWKFTRIEYDFLIDYLAIIGFSGIMTSFIMVTFFYKIYFLICPQD